MGKDVTIIYQGGSGGFMLFYYLLLSGNYTTGLPFIDTHKGVEYYISQQFKKETELAKWKTTEFWPDNLKCKNTQTEKSKLFLICNPLFNSDKLKENLEIANGTDVVLLYTDLKTQLRLAYEKRAYWFTETSKNYFSAPVNEKEYIKNILKNYAEFNQEKVDPVVPLIIDTFKPTEIIKLQNLIKNNCNERQRTFINHWLSLQPGKAKLNIL